MNGELPLQDKEVWDDSSLISQWDAAREEYRKYHSIESGHETTHESTSERPENKNEQEENTTEQRDIDENSVPESEIMNLTVQAMDVEVTEGDSGREQDNTFDKSTIDSSHDSIKAGQATPASANTADANPAHNPAVPLQGLDESTRNLVMAWYWAGYYHGLHVGKRSV